MEELISVLKEMNTSLVDLTYGRDLAGNPGTTEKIAMELVALNKSMDHIVMSLENLEGINESLIDLRAMIEEKYLDNKKETT